LQEEWEASQHIWNAGRLQGHGGLLLKGDRGRELSLRVWTEIGLLPVCTSFVEGSALAFGLNRKGATSLTLALEEIFSYLCRISGQDRPVAIMVSSRSYYVLVEVASPVMDFDMRLFNLTAGVSADDDTAIEQMGLLIASRFVDRLNVKRATDGGLLLSLVKEKTYPEADHEPAFEPKTLENFTVSRPSPELIKIIAAAIKGGYPASHFPKAFQYPGKVVDMVEGGEYEVLAATGPDGSPGGALFWHWMSEKTVELFGPYVFGQSNGAAVAEGLMNSCIAALAKSNALGLVSLLPTKELPKGDLEELGSLTLYNGDGDPASLKAYFRQMHEDPGSYCWCHPELESFLLQNYRRLSMPRQLMAVKDQGEAKKPFSVLAVDIDRSPKKATIRPVSFGSDMEENLKAHIRLLKKEGLRNIFFVMDLGVSWHTYFTPYLRSCLFAPRVVVPYGGDGDQVIFQLDE
jgi:anti-sigma regulatory factor (Ser/Thr protein kinase)